MDEHMELITKLAHVHKRPGVELDDLIQEGYMGLLEAQKRFDPSHDTKFTTYAVWWIKKYMKSFLAEETKQKNLPRLAQVTKEPSQNELLESEEDFTNLTESLLTLGVQDLVLVVLRYGLGAAEPLSYDQIGKYFGRSREWARKRIKKVLKKLRG